MLYGVFLIMNAFFKGASSTWMPRQLLYYCPLQICYSRILKGWPQCYHIARAIWRICTFLIFINSNPGRFRQSSVFFFTRIEIIYSCHLAPWYTEQLQHTSRDPLLLKTRDPYSEGTYCGIFKNKELSRWFHKTFVSVSCWFVIKICFHKTFDNMINDVHYLLGQVPVI
jgi:hypothetical protein